MYTIILNDQSFEILRYGHYIEINNQHQFSNATVTFIDNNDNRERLKELQNNIITSLSIKKDNEIIYQFNDLNANLIILIDEIFELKANIVFYNILEETNENTNNTIID